MSPRPLSIGLALTALCLATLTLNGCQRASKPSAEHAHDHGSHSHDGHDHGHDHDHGSGEPDHEHPPFQLEVVNASFGFESGKPFDLRLVVRNEATGEVQKTFERLHGEKLHLIVVDEGLTHFQHLHPAIDADGLWTQRLSLPFGGKFWLFVDGAADAATFFAGTQLIARGDPGPKPEFRLDATSSEAGVQAEILEGAKIAGGDPVRLSIKLSPTDGWEPYLDEPGHLVMVRADGKEYTHAHPQGPIKEGVARFEAHLHESGLYRAWAQFQRNGKPVTLSFTIEVSHAQ